MLFDVFYDVFLGGGSVFNEFQFSRQKKSYMLCDMNAMIVVILDGNVIFLHFEIFRLRPRYM
ncbi:MAG: DNA adenine methylase [Clostridia bacterium]|nr:DNA adenine methylase [Clostridia bacterium]